MKTPPTSYPCCCACHPQLVVHRQPRCGCGKPAVPPKGHACCCHCHAQIEVHYKPCCDCGKPVVPPKPSCCPPPIQPQPGTGEVPQDTPPPKPKTSPVPPWTVGKPEPGSPGEIPWFRGIIGGIGRNGPTFGPRKDEYLPYLLVRTSSGDRGNRPLSGVFWESPDIFVAPNLEADTAPLMPPTLGGVAKANQPNTLYAHVWNLGKAPAYRVRVEFYWFNPSLGISRADANLIGAAWIDLGNRFNTQSDWTEVQTSYGKWMSKGSHAIVRCPVTWVPKFENDGHECLVVRVLEPILDAVGPNQYSAAQDRHVAQRNISVVQAASPAEIDLTLDLGYADAPGDAEVEVELDAPSAMEWLQLYAGNRTPGFTAPAAGVVAGLMPPTAISARAVQLQQLPYNCRVPLLKPREKFHRGCDPLRITFHASVQDLRPHQAQVLRIKQKQGSNIIGGYSVVLIKP
jgi:hypothetical protein